MVLAQKQKYRPMEQDREPIDKPIHLFLTKEERIYNRAKHSLGKPLTLRKIEGKIEGGGRG